MGGPPVPGAPGAAQAGARVAPGDRLRAELASSPPVLMPGVWDPLSALLAERAGHRVVFLSGFAVAGTSLGAPDIGLLTQTEVADVARRTAGAAQGVCLVVDGDTGYGGPRNVARTVELWESAGAAGIFLEDQVWPKRCGHMADKEVVPVEEWLAKLRAALEARTHLHVTARTDARGPLGLDAALERAQAAIEVGVDAVFVEAPASDDELARVGEALAGTVAVANMVEAGRTPLHTPSELADLGFELIVSPVTALFAATRALGRVYRRLADDGTVREHLDELVAFDEFTALVGLDEARAADRRAQPPASG